MDIQVKKKKKRDIQVKKKKPENQTLGLILFHNLPKYST